MSIARVHTVKKSRKAQTCGRCGKHLPPGSAYRHFTVGFRGFKRSRCMDCPYPRQSELESSRLAEVYAAVEEAEDAIAAIDVSTAKDAASLETDIEAFLEGVESAADEVAEEYRDAAEAMGDAGQDNEDRADAVEAGGQEATCWNSPGDAYCDEHALDGLFVPGCPDCEDAVRGIIDSAVEHVGGLDFTG